MINRLAPVAMAAALIVSTNIPAYAADWANFHQIKTGLEPSGSLLEHIWAAEIRADTEAAKRDGGAPFNGKMVVLTDGQQRPENFVVSSLSAGGMTYTISAMLQSNCDFGANGATAGVEPVRCEARLTTGEGGSAKSVTLSDRACFVWPYPNTDLSRDYTRASFDGTTLVMESYVEGRIIDDCTLTVRF